MYGAQTDLVIPSFTTQFENDVEMYGAQTQKNVSGAEAKFENDVEMYGAQTTICRQKC